MRTAKIWVFAGRTATLLVLSCRGLYVLLKTQKPAYGSSYVSPKRYNQAAEVDLNGIDKLEELKAIIKRQNLICIFFINLFFTKLA